MVNPDLGDTVVGGVGVYVWVSCHDQKADLDRQVARLRAWGLMGAAGWWVWRPKSGRA